MYIDEIKEDFLCNSFSFTTKNGGSYSIRVTSSVEELLYPKASSIIRDKEYAYINVTRDVEGRSLICEAAPVSEEIRSNNINKCIAAMNIRTRAVRAIG